MMDIFTKIWIWIKGNILLSIGILLVVILLFFPKLLKGLFRTRRIRHRPGYYATRSGKPLPRRVTGKNRTTRPPGSKYSQRKQYTKGGKLKKPWQIAGSEAARRHMAKIRRMR